MKKHNVLKVIGIAFLVLAVLTWIIPAGSYSSGSYVKSGTMPFGIFDFTRIPLIAITNLVQYSLVLLVIGGFYGVLNKTGVYTSLVDKVVKKFSKKEKKFLVLSILVFAILSSVVGTNFAILILVPFMVAVIMLLGYSKLVAMLSTIGAMLTGTLAAICNTEIFTVFAQYLTLDLTKNILVNIVFFVIVIVLYILLVLAISKNEKIVTKEKKATAKSTKATKTVKETKTTSKKTTKAETKAKKDVITVKEETKEEREILFYDAKAVNKKKSFVPLTVILCIILLISFVAMFNWPTLLKMTFFDEIYESVIGIKVGDYTLIKNILGTLTPFGYWTNYEFIMFILLCIPFIAWLYNVKFDDVIDGFASGAKKLAKPAIYVLLANLLYAAMYSTSTGDNIFYTIIHFFLGLSEKFNAIVVGSITLIGGFIFSDFSALASTMATPITSVYASTNMYPIIAFIMQSIYGLLMFIAPSSMLLIVGLTCFDISYGKWLKTIWKYLLKVFIVIILVLIILSMFV